MNDRELEARLRAGYRARASETEPAPLSLRRDVGAIPRIPAPRRRRFGAGRGTTLLAAAAAAVLVGGALAVGSGVLRRTAVNPPAPSSGPLAIASADTTTPSPIASLAPSPTPASLDLTWTQVPLDEQSPRLAWVGDQFVLADVDSGTVRTSTDGQSWQPMQAGDAAKGYVDLLSGSRGSWQGETVGWLNPEDGPDISGPPPSNPRHIVTIVHPPSAPISTLPFKGQIESIGIGPKGFVAETHSALDFEHWVTKKLGLRTNNDWTMHTKSMTFQSGVLQIKLNNRSGLKVVWADQGYEPGDLYDGGFGWFSPDGEHWTEMAPRDNSGSDFGSTLPMGAFGNVVGVSDGFIAGGDGGMWFSAGGLTWRFLGAESGGNLQPWMGGALVTDGDTPFDLWTSSGKSRLPAAADLQGMVGTGPLGLVTLAYGAQTAFVSRNGTDVGSSPIPAQMSAATGRLWGGFAPRVAVGDRSVLVLEGHQESSPAWTLWLGTFQP